MKRVIVLGDQRKGEVVRTVERFLPELKRKADVVLVDLEMKENLEELQADVVIAFGGDGSILSTARRLGSNQIPVVGVNLGTFGFLAEFEVEEFGSNLDRILSGDVLISERMMISCRITRGVELIHESLALNEVLISTTTPGRMIYCSLEIDGEEVTTFGGDGLIIATPVGSTAHSLAAGGPVLSPMLEGFIVTPIAPHTLTNRPLVVAPSSKLNLCARGAADPAVATVDGQESVELRQEDIVRLSKAEQKFRVVETGMRTYFRTLREKLHWGGYRGGDKG